MIFSNIPLNSGVGSSASSISSIFQSLICLFGIYVSNGYYFSFCKKIENFFHGNSSGIDIFCVIFGGNILYNDFIYNKISILYNNALLIHTGKPILNTFNCVFFVSIVFIKFNFFVLFLSISFGIYFSLLNGSCFLLKYYIKYNLYLLKLLGVVSYKVSCFINDIENIGGCAKISGSECIFGDNSGFIIVFGVCFNFLFYYSVYYSYYIYNIKNNIFGVRFV